MAAARLDAAGTRFVHDLWRVDLQSGATHRLTEGDTDNTAPAFRGDGSLLFLSARVVDGEADASARQVWMLPVQGGEARALTDEPCGVRAFRAAAAGHTLVVLAPRLADVPLELQRATAASRRKGGPSLRRYRRMPVRHWDHWLSPDHVHFVAFDAHGRERRELTPDATHAYREAQWELAADGSFLITTSRQVGPDRMGVVDLVGIETTCVAAPWPVASAPLTEHERPVVSGDGLTVAYVRHSRRPGALGPKELVLQRLDGTGARRLKGVDRWLVPEAFSPDGAALLATGDDRGATPVFWVDLETGQVAPLVEGAGGHHANVRVATDGSVYALRDSLLRPPELGTFGHWRAPEPPRVLSQLSGVELEALDATVEVGELVVQVSGRPVQAHVLRPRSAIGRAPALLWVHGGPFTQWTDAWHWRWNAAFFAARGHVVVMPNPAGSTGFGQPLTEEAFGNRWGREAYDDVIAVTDALVELPYVDPSRVVAMGGSFGGYMVNWLAANSLRFAGVVTHAGVYDLAGFHGTTDWPADFAHTLGGLQPDRDREEWERYSPRRLIDRWRTPTLILHGERDYRVPVSEALALFEALESRGVDAELAVFPDEGHWIERPRNIAAWYGVVVEFLERRLA